MASLQKLPSSKVSLLSFLKGSIVKKVFTVVGYALYIFSYNSMRGRIIYLEDLYVIPEFRGKGVGKQLLKEVAKIGQDRQCYQIQFAVLNWNQQAIDFYRAQGAIDLTEETGYHIFRFEDTAMTKLQGRKLIHEAQRNVPAPTKAKCR